MDAALRVLLIEDNPDDAELISLELETLGEVLQVQRVESAATMAQALDKTLWDLIIADYEVPGFGAFEALNLVQARSLDIPFIVVSGSIQETTAVQLMRLGAHDYVLKHNLQRLVPVIQRELREAQIRLERRQALWQIEYLAYHDPQTGLPNQNRLLEDIALEIEAKRPYVVAFLELDQYRDFRYGYGYPISHQLLHLAGQRLRTVLPDQAMLARVGRDDEFAILFRNMDLVTVQACQLPRLHHAFDLPLELGHLRPLLSWSVGLTDSTLDWVEADACLRAAEMANYRARHQSYGGAVVYHPPMQAQAQARSQLETDLRHALRQGHLQVAYQPIVALQTGQLVGFEALARWHHPRQGWISPVEFIALAEQTGLILPLGNWVFDQVLMQLSQWQRAFPQQLPLFVAVNLSALQLCQPACMTHLLHQYQAAQLHEQVSVVLEVTEGVLLHDMEAAIAHLEACQRGGLRISLDDFGTGYSSLAYLHRLPINTIKIDRSFVDRMLVNSQDADIVRTIQTLAQALGMAVVAEGIEHLEQLQALQALSCQYGQGYFLAAPLTPAEVHQLLTQEQGHRCPYPLPQRRSPLLPIAPTSVLPPFWKP